MRKLRLMALLPALLGIAPAALADFDGPTPLAWRWAQGSAVSSKGMPLVVGNTVYIAAGQRVYALDKATGNQKWKFPTVQNVDGYFRTSPVMSDGTVVVTTSKTLYGLDAATGLQKWYYTVTDPAQAIAGQAVSAGKYVVFALGEDFLMAVNGADGKASWKDPQAIPDKLKGNLASFQNNVYYFTQTQTLYTMDVAAPNSSKKIQTFSLVSEDITPVVNSDVLYVNSSSYVVALNAFSGGSRWQKDTGEDLVFGPAASADSVAAVSRDGILTIMDVNGRIRTVRDEEKKTSGPMKVDLGAGPLARPTAVGKFFVVPTTNGVLNLVDPTNGQIVWRYAIHPMSASGKKPAPTTGTQRPDESLYTVGAAGPATEAGDTLLVLALDGSLLAFDKNFGVDVTGPDLKLAFPSEGAQVSGQDLTIVFQVSDEATGVNEKTLKIAANGQDLDFEYTGDGLASVTFSSLTKNKPFADGRAEFTVSCSDWIGNVSNRHFTLIIDNSLRPLSRPPETRQPAGGGGGGGRFGGGGGRGGGGGG